MAIDFRKEELLTFSQIAKLLPKRRAGRPVTPSCVFRWSNEGCKGVTLEYTQVGGARCTSMDAIQRFFDSLTKAQEPKAVPTAAAAPTPTVLSKQRQERSRQARERLQAAGF